MVANGAAAAGGAGSTCFALTVRTLPKWRDPYRQLAFYVFEKVHDVSMTILLSHTSAPSSLFAASICKNSLPAEETHTPPQHRHKQCPSPFKNFEVRVVKADEHL